MSLFRIGIVLAGAIMLLPVEDQKQAEPSATAMRTTQQSATFCERNPATCANARDGWALFLRKAEYAMELSARLLREQLGRSLSNDGATPPAAQQAAYRPSHTDFAGPATPALPMRAEQPRAQHRTYPMDNPSRWR